MALVTADTDLGLIPPRRLGALLEQARTDANWGYLEVSVASGGRFSPTELRAIEAGKSHLDDERVRTLTELYGIELERLIPQRSLLVIDRDERSQESADDARNETDRQVLLRYLAFVYHLRSTPPGRPIVLRSRDIDVLAEFLEATPASVHEVLTRMMEHSRKDLVRVLRSVAGRPALPGLGLLVALTDAGALLLVRPLAGDPPAA